jgi:SAM-dependent methyltransferase
VTRKIETQPTNHPGRRPPARSTTDVSDALLSLCRQLASEALLLDRCAFVRVSANDLGAIPDASVDAVTIRSVLNYVEHKDAAFREFFRQLQPPETDPMLNFDERDLFQSAERAGFTDLHLDYSARLAQWPNIEWDVLIAARRLLNHRYRTNLRELRVGREAAFVVSRAAARRMRPAAV